MKEETPVCHDCGETLKEGDECMIYDLPEGKFFKCKKCHKEDSCLRDFRDCEVYSRIVGYIRPVDQWNNGKKEEWSDRKNFQLKTKKK